jgi:TMEM175 potassium channel family protein
VSEATEAERRELDRVGAFSDGVFAIAITLLVLNLDVPSSVSGADLGDALGDLGDDIEAYFIGFSVMGIFWYGHHKLFAQIERSSGRLIVVNFVLLAMIAVMPFTTDLIGTYNVPLAIAVYAANVGLASLADGLTELVAVRERLAAPGKLRDERTVMISTVLRFAIFAVSIPLAWVSITVAQLSWFALLLAPRITRALAGRR